MEKCHMTGCHKMMSHKWSHMNEYRKIAHRLCNSCISSIQELNKNSIEFFLF